MRGITTDNTADMIEGVELLRRELYSSTCFNEYKVTRNFHNRWVAHVLSLAVKEYMKMIYDKLAKIRKLLAFIRSSIRRRDQFGDVKVEVGPKCEVPRLHVEIRLSSIFQMIWMSFIARRVVMELVSTEEDLKTMPVGEAE